MKCYSDIQTWVMWRYKRYAMHYDDKTYAIEWQEKPLVRYTQSGTTWYLPTKFHYQQPLILKTEDFNNRFHWFNFSFNFVILIFNFNVEIRLYVKTRLVTKTCKKGDLPSAHDLYSF
jgi:hypothetical protein